MTLQGLDLIQFFCVTEVRLYLESVLHTHLTYALSLSPSLSQARTHTQTSRSHTHTPPLKNEKPANF